MRADSVARRVSLRDLPSLLAAGVSALVATLAVFASLERGRVSVQPPPPVIAPPPTVANTVSSAEIDALRKQLAGVQAAMAAIKSAPEGSKLAASVEALRLDLNEVGTRLQRLEQALMATPEKALQFVLLSKEVESMRTQQQVNAATTKDAIDRIYDLNKWLLGGIAVSVLTLALASTFRAPRPDPVEGSRSDA